MHRAITPNQIRAARVYLDWSQEQLAETTDLGKSTIRNLEAGYISLPSAAKVRKIFERNGLEFTEGDGVRRRTDGVRLIKSPNSCEEFFIDLVETLREKQGELLIVARSENTLLRSCGLAGEPALKQLELLDTVAIVKCLFLETAAQTLSLPAFEFRIAPQHLAISDKIYFIYGNKLALVANNGPKNDFNFILIDAPGFTELWREEFHDMWELSSPAVRMARKSTSGRGNL